MIKKIIVSTNLAETSLTIEGVEIVIDCGLARIPSFDESRGINTLLLKRFQLHQQIRGLVVQVEFAQAFVSGFGLSLKT